MNKKAKLSTIIIIVVIAVIFIFTAINIFQKPFVAEPEVEVPTVPVAEEVGKEIITRTPSLTQTLVDETGAGHSRVYNIGELVYIDFGLIGFSLEKTGDYYASLSYTTTVLDANNNPVEGFDDLLIAEKERTQSNEFEAFTATYFVPTINLEPGNYRVVTKVTDEIASQTHTAESLITVKEHDALAIVGFDFGYYDPAAPLFEPVEQEWELGSSIDFYFHVRGVASVQNKPDVHVDLNVYDPAGNKMENKSVKDFFVDNAQYQTKPNYFVINGILRTGDIQPGTYRVELVANDMISKQNATAEKELVII